MPNAVLVKATFAVTGRTILEHAGVSHFSRPTYLGDVVAYNEEQAEQVAMIRWPGWDDYTFWTKDEAVAA